MPVQNKAASWLRLQETDLVLEADAEVWATIDGGEASSRKDVPVKLAPFDPEERRRSKPYVLGCAMVLRFRAQQHSPNDYGRH